MRSSTADDQSLELVSLDRYSSDPSDSDEEQVSRYKAYKTRILTYIRHNYLVMIKLLTLFSFCSIVLMTVLFFKFYLSDPTPSASANYINHTEYRNEIANMISGSNITFIQSNNHQLGFESSAVPCRKIKCNRLEAPCNITSAGYIEIKIYVCCSCLPTPYRLRYYLKSTITRKVTLYFERDDLDVKSMSQADLRVLEPLPHLAGSWDITQFADSEYLLQYGGVTVVDEAE